MNRLKTSNINWLKHWLTWTTLIALAGIYILIKIFKFEEYYGLDLLFQIIPDLIAALIAFLVVYYLFIRKGISNEREEELNLLNEIRNEQSMSKETLEKINNELSILIDNAHNSHEIVKIIKGQNERIRNLILHCAKSGPFVGRFYTQTMKKYHEEFSIESNGFVITNEYLSLIIYIQFWEYLVAQQKKIPYNSSNSPIIARVVHSNTIHIWTNKHDKYKEFTNKLLRLQKEFVDAGGIIVRILIGKTFEPDKAYKNVIALMRQYRIDIKYLQQSEYNKLDYDFVLLMDENMVLKWFSDASGNTLYKTVIHDFVEKQVWEKWSELFDELKHKGGDHEIKSIPDDRQYYYKSNNKG
ncbi:MAG: hypothetical protein R3D58_10405 [Saprospiraceae bacterium]